MELKQAKEQLIEAQEKVRIMEETQSLQKEEKEGNGSGRRRLVLTEEEKQ